MRRIFTATIIVSLLILSARAAICQQSGPAAATQTQTAQLDEKARKIKRTVEKIGIAGKLTLYLKNGEELYGNVVRYDEESLQITEIDLKQVVTIQYRNIKKVREGYGNFNLLTGKRTNPPKGVKIGTFIGVLVFALVIPIIAIATAKD